MAHPPALQRTPGIPYGDNGHEARRASVSSSYFPEAESQAGTSRSPTDAPFPGGFVRAPSFPVPTIPEVLAPTGQHNNGYLTAYDTSSLFFDSPSPSSPNYPTQYEFPRPVSDTAVPLHIPRPARHSSLEGASTTSSPPSAGAILHRARTSPAPKLPPKPRLHPPGHGNISYPDLRPKFELYPPPPPRHDTKPSPPHITATPEQQSPSRPPPLLPPKPDNILYPPLPPKPPQLQHADAANVEHHDPVPAPSGVPQSPVPLVSAFTSPLPQFSAAASPLNEEDDQLARALALSMTEQGPASHHDDEDEALEAAMRESLLIHQAASGPPSAHDDDDAPTPTASAWSGWSHKDLQSTPATSSSSHESLSNGPSYASSLAPSKSKLSQIEEDEAFARQLAQEEEQAVAAELSAMQAKTADASSSTVSSPEPPPPWTPPEAGPSTLSAPSSSPSLSSLHDRTPSPVRTRRHSESPNNVRPLPRPNRASMAMPSPPLPNTRPPSVDVASLHPPSLPSTRPPSMDAMSPPPPQLPTLTRPTSVVSASELTGVNELWLEEESPTLLEPTPAPSARFIDPELTRGISMSFAAPNLAESALPELAVPDVVELPYGKAAPMHIQAPSWRQMLKLLARMSGSRIEPTVEAIAQVKDGSGLRLRAVVQFVKVHPASPDWRTILYLTIDHDVPPSTPNAWRFTNGDVGTLPFSYTLSTVPALLRDSPDAPLAKWYAVPATQRLPYPTLPIEFPDLALYLHAALQESRKAIHDSSSGMRRLARMVDDFYPKEKEVDDLSPKKPFFRRLIGRGRNKEGGRNQDTYELVTPFIASEWG